LPEEFGNSKDGGGPDVFRLTEATSNAILPPAPAFKSEADDWAGVDCAEGDWTFCDWGHVVAHIVPINTAKSAFRNRSLMLHVPGG
jgi:hypothetical protein